MPSLGNVTFQSFLPRCNCLCGQVQPVSCSHSFLHTLFLQALSFRGDLWVVGAQNAGKSSLLAAMKRLAGTGGKGEPTIAPMPGTTLGLIQVRSPRTYDCMAAMRISGVLVGGADQPLKGFTAVLLPWLVNTDTTDVMVRIIAWQLPYCGHCFISASYNSAMRCIQWSVFPFSGTCACACRCQAYPWAPSIVHLTHPVCHMTTSSPPT